MLINVGDEKGALFDAAVRRANPKLALELGTYCGYSALRIARSAPTAKVYSVELAEANAANARQIWAHAGLADRITCVVGTIGDGRHTLDALRRRMHGIQFMAHLISADFHRLIRSKDAVSRRAPGRVILDTGDGCIQGSIVVRRQHQCRGRGAAEVPSSTVRPADRGNADGDTGTSTECRHVGVPRPL